MFPMKSGYWQNWSGSVKFNPQHIFTPNSIEEVVAIVKKANIENKKIRVVGSRHSFTPLISTTDFLVSLDQLQGVISIDKEKQIAEVWAGTKLERLGQELYEFGFAQENLGDINVQSIAGALLTGTHGTGVQHGILATQIEELTIVLPNGEVLVCSKIKNIDLYKAIGVSLGLLGIVVKMKIRIKPATTYRYESKKIQTVELYHRIEEMKNENEHFEFYMFPYSKNIQVKLMNETRTKNHSFKFEKWKVATIENNVFWFLSEISRNIPKTSRMISRLSAKNVPNSRMVGPSFQLFSTVRNVKFNEMEYSIPKVYMVDATKEIQEEIIKNKFNVHFPIECRFVKADHFMISPASARDSAYIAIHMYKGMPHQDYFYRIEEILQSYGGRPHWGKMHNMTIVQLENLYPHLSQFLEIRSKLDPKNVFVNAYLGKLFNIG
ncbi:D-arabinono-1,4-lactone oxidase [Gottfriedia solisilvae]|uniref:FAD-binding oxidoreductase n=1 Tax=Gottfriedia solisilvae TaxID=1516104 RepID=A0A8J3EY40_9BACI|nr:FAD-binding oxidoreductase [Gottfriedia solisilvae]